MSFSNATTPFRHNKKSEKLTHRNFAFNILEKLIVYKLDNQDLERRIENAKKKLEKPEASRFNNNSYAMKIATDLIAGVVVGSFLGHFLDVNLNTSPIFFLALVFLGAAAAFYSFYKEYIKDLDNQEKENKDE